MHLRRILPILVALTLALGGCGGGQESTHVLRYTAIPDQNTTELTEKFQPVAGSEFELKADLVLLAMGFVHPVHEGMLKELGVDLDARGNVQADTQQYRTSLDKVFSAGDMRRGQSLVVWAIREGRQCARAVDEYLMGSSDLPR